ncbi:MAG: hypothetical protein M3440_14100 [Chloroflexota bacterium]|nr:hypothetical protein [Chloroflexota bacterium]
MPKFRKKPVVIEAEQFTGNFLKELDFPENFAYAGDMSSLVIETLEGNMTANPGDWIIKGVNGEFYPCKPDIFEKTYEAVEGEGE